MSLSFTNPRDPQNRALRAKLEEWLRESELLGGGERLLEVFEESDRCGPSCPHAQTVLRIAAGDGHAAEASRELRIEKPLVFVRRADIRALASNV